MQPQCGAQILLITLSCNFQKVFQNKTTLGFRLLKIIKELVPGGAVVSWERTRRLGCWVSVGSLTSSMIL